MVNSTELNYTPDYAIPPGESLRETLEELGLTQAEFARRAGLSTKHVNQVIKGEAAITDETALVIERVTGVPSRLWMRLESSYRSRLIALGEVDEFSSANEWIARLPVRELVEQNWIEDSSDRTTLARQLLSFFGVASIDAWESVWQDRLRVVWLRESGGGRTDLDALASWLRTGEVSARRLVQDKGLSPYDERAFRSEFDAIRRATRKPRTAVATVQDICASCGVTFVVTDAFSGSRASGAARWLAPGRPMIHLSRRFRRDDSFWFSFFHEAGHLLLHPKKAVYVDDLFNGGLSEADDRETEAHAFAVRALLPGVTRDDLLGLKTHRDVMDLADRIGVAPSIIVGQLHHRRMKAHSWGRRLIREVRLSTE